MAGTKRLAISQGAVNGTDGRGTAAGGILDLPISGAWLYIPQVFGDERGSFHEWFRAEQFTEKIGWPFQVAQANLSRSARGVVRGIHLADVPPGQAKLVTCVAGSVCDVLVDLRVGSPTFGKHCAVDLTEDNNLCLFVPLGVGHGFAATSDKATLNYLVTEAYNPEKEWGIHPFDPELGIDWPVGEDQAILSAKDAAAPFLSDATVSARLPQFREVRAWEKELASEWQAAMEFADESWDV